MKIIFTNHARERMQERGISEKEVVECIHHSDNVLKDDTHVCRFQRRFSHGILQVVAEQKRNYFVVITVYPL